MSDVAAALPIGLSWVPKLPSLPTTKKDSGPNPSDARESIWKPGSELVDGLFVPPRDPRKANKLARKNVKDTTGKGWFDMPAPSITPELKKDLEILQAEHGLWALFAFKPVGSRRGLRIWPDPAGGYSAVLFRDGAVIALDGEPKESWTKPVSVIVAGLLVPAVMVAIALKGVPERLRSSRVVLGVFPPWILVSAVIIFARVRTRPRAPP